MKINGTLNKTALIYGDERLKFSELTLIVETVAVNLQQRGIKPGQIVPIVLPRGNTPIVSVLALWQIGAVPTIVEDTYPPDRIEYICKECRAKFIIDQKCYNELSVKGKSVAIDEYKWQDFDPAMIIFTSGSTGNPKGVILPAMAVNRSIINPAKFFVPNDEFLCIAPLSFVALLNCVFAQLMMGITVHIAADSVRKDVKALVAYIEKEKITSMFLPSSLAPIVLRLTSSLRIAFVGSERVRNVYSDKTICVNSYGASETASAIIAHQIDKPYDNTPIGQPLDDVSAYILDDDLQPVKEGEKGELCISGQIAIGYLNLPELTKEHFVKNPYSKNEHDKMLFRTNDIVRLLPSGDIEYVERKDWLLKIHGSRVEPGDVEAAIMALAPVKAVVVGFESHGETEMYAAYTSNEKIDPKSIRDELEKKLPAYMIPQIIEQIESMPLNINGKIDRTKIKPTEDSRYKIEYEEPTNEKEKLICSAFCEIFKVDKVGILDDFVSLGGTSLTAVQLQDLLPFTVSATDILSLRTPKAIALCDAPNIPILDDIKYWKLGANELLWIQTFKMFPNAFGLIINVPISIKGLLDVARLKEVIKALLKKHRMLRTNYCEINGEIMRSFTDVPDNCLDIYTIQNSDVIKTFEQVQKPFVLEEGNLCKFLLFEAEPKEHVLWISALHSIIDGPGIQILVNELFEFYDSKPCITVRNAEILRPDCFDLQETARDSQRYIDEKEFYCKMIDNSQKRLPFPWTKDNKPVARPIDTTLSHEFDENILKESARLHGVTVFSILVAATAAMIGEACRTKDVFLMLTMNLRYSYPQLEKSIGAYLDVVPIRLQITNSDFVEFVKNTDRIILEIQSKMASGGTEWLLNSTQDIVNEPILSINFRKELVIPECNDLMLKQMPLPHLGESEPISGGFAEFNQSGSIVQTVFRFPFGDCPEEIGTKMIDKFVSLIDNFSKKRIKVSVIVPVYNVEKYLPRCLDSLIKQTLKEIEIICINDCSTDRSINVIKDYANKDSRIKLIDFEKNQGVASARNAGLDIAKGEFVGFLDSDDEVDLCFYETLYEKAKSRGADISKGAYKRIDVDGRESVETRVNELVRLNKAYFSASFWTAIYNNEIIQNNNIRFPLDIAIGEDLVFQTKCLLESKKITTSDFVYYWYHLREDSAVGPIRAGGFLSKEKMDTFIKAFEMIIDYTNERFQAGCVDAKTYDILFYNNFCFSVIIVLNTDDAHIKNECCSLVLKFYQSCLRKDALDEKLQEEQRGLYSFLREGDVKKLTCYFVENYTLEDILYKNDIRSIAYFTR